MTGDYRLTEQIGFRLRAAQQRHLEIFARHLPEITPPQWAALAMLAESGPCSQNELGRRIATDAATAKGIVDRLRARGLVATRPAAHDARRLTLSLTEAGADFVARGLPLARAITAETLAGLTPDEADRLSALLQRLAYGAG